MNEEYLWQKTGDDTETMRLERALAAFRYRETDPPVLPVTAGHKSDRKLRLAAAFAIPAFAAAVTIGVLWFQSVNTDDATEVTFVHHPSVEQNAAPNPEPPAPAVAPPGDEVPGQPLRTGGVKPLSAAARDRTKGVVRPRGRKSGTAVLTREERYAYQQLMLALSISSSSLNVVRDAVNGVENNQPQQNDR